MEKTNILLNYEKALSSLFKALSLSPALTVFVRALIIASKGQKNFSISQRDLAKLYRKGGSGTEKADIQNVRDRIKALEQWQAKHKIELIRIVERGGKEHDETGKTVYKATKYRFVALYKFIRVINSVSDAESEEKITDVIEKLKKQYKPSKPRKKYHPRRSIATAKKNIFTKFKIIINLWQEVNKTTPISYCTDILTELKTLLDEWKKEFLEKHGREKRLADFEKLGNVQKADFEDNSNHSLGLKSSA